MVKALGVRNRFTIAFRRHLIAQGIDNALMPEMANEGGVARFVDQRPDTRQG